MNLPVTEDNSRKAELVRVAARLFRDHGYERTTVRDIGNAVGLQSGSLFYHFRTKEEILVAVMALGMPQFRYPNYIDRKEPEVRKI